MQFKSLALTAFLVATAQAAPAPVTPNPNRRDTLTYQSSDASVNDCGDSTFINQSSGGSPAVSDCQHLASNIAGGGTWSVALGSQRTLATYGSCAFGVTPDGSGSDAWYAYIGNQDIIDLINTSISMFTYNGLVGAKGVMHCQGGETSGEQVTWGIYHT